jgi:hypothetical protein
MMIPILKRIIFFALAILVLIAFSVALLVNKEPLSQTTGIAQGAILKWEKTYGDNGDDRAFFAVPTKNGYLVVGSSTSNEKSITEAWALRVNNSGDELWNRKYLQNLGTEFRSAICLDDGFLLVGNTFLESSKIEGYVAKIDLEGNPLWNVTISAVSGVNKIFSASKSPDGFVLAGLTDASGGNSSKTWLIGLDKNGTLSWIKTFGGVGESAGKSVAVSGDNILLAGYSDVSGTGNFDFLVIKTDLFGNILWDKTYGGLESDKAYSLISTPDGAVIAGDTRSKGAGDCDAWVIKIDLDGKLIWDKTFGGSDFDTSSYVTTSFDGGYLLCGTTFSFGNGYRDFWMFEISDLGQLKWSCTVGRSGYEEAYVVIQDNNNDLFAAGWTNSICKGRYDFYLVKIGVV